MLQRSQIEQILRINGLSPSAPDQEIKSVLLSARWHEDDVEAAIMVLREDTKDHTTHVDTLHRVFHTDQKLDPDAVTALLGIEMDVTSAELPKHAGNASGGLRFNSMVSLTLLSLILSLVFVFAAMWFLQMGLFHHLR